MYKKEKKLTGLFNDTFVIKIHVPDRFIWRKNPLHSLVWITDLILHTHCGKCNTTVESGSHSIGSTEWKGTLFLGPWGVSLSIKHFKHLTILAYHQWWWSWNDHQWDKDT